MNKLDFEINYETNHFNKFPHDVFSDEEKKLYEEIKKLKKELKDEVIILAHHYQRKWIGDLGDFIGDSFQLSREAASRKEFKKIIFAGVHFMAESADILSDDDQVVYLPNVQAGCPMADMTSIGDLEFAWKELNSMLSHKEKIIPITYMNSSARVKAFCGKHDGIVCTSSNAKKIFKWALNTGDKILFMPDKNLGVNTANSLGIDKDEQLIYDLKKENGGASVKSLKKSKVILWNGYCHVHEFFNLDMVRKIKEKYPKYKLVVHPESNPEVIELADSIGSTKHICDYVEKTSPGDVIVIGTEINSLSFISTV